MNQIHYITLDQVHDIVPTMHYVIADSLSEYINYCRLSKVSRFNAIYVHTFGYLRSVINTAVVYYNKAPYDIQVNLLQFINASRNIIFIIKDESHDHTYIEDSYSTNISTIKSIW